MAEEHILVIDDNVEIINFLTDLLQSLDYSVSSATWGQEGLKKALDEQPDLILLDLNLPDTSGINVLEALNEHEIRSSVILMTLHGSEQVAAKVFRLGVRDYIIKPFDVDELLKSVERALEAGRLRQEREELIEELSETNRRLKQRMKELSTLHAVGRSVASLMAPGELFRRILDAAVYLTGAEMAAIFVFDAQKNPQLEAVKDSKVYYMNQEQSVNDECAQQVGREGRTIIHSGPGSPPCFVEAFGRRATGSIYVPIQLANEPQGVLAVAYLEEGHRPTPETQARLATLSDQIAIALENARLHSALQETVASRTLQETIVALSHYINNPLQTLWSATEILESDPTDTQLLEVLREEIQRISVVVSVMRDITKPKSALYMGTTQMLNIEKELRARLESKENPFRKE
jgi:two-component system NtrC family sensor kinase